MILKDYFAFLSPLLDRELLEGSKYVLLSVFQAPSTGLS